MALALHAGAATLNKCIDAKGQVTYSNLPCHNAREVRTVEIDPAPQPDPVRSPPPSKRLHAETDGCLEPGSPRSRTQEAASRLFLIKPTAPPS